MTIDCSKCKQKNSCCDFGAWVDLEEAKKILSLGLKGDFYHLEEDKSFPSGYKVGTSYEDNRCSFLDPDGLCAIHKVDYNLKPLHCREFPYENGELSPFADVLCPAVKSKKRKEETGNIAMNIFVGNLPFDANEGDVQKLFEGFGNVASVAIVMSKEKKAPKSRGFGFVRMPDEQQAFAAITALNGKEFMGRVLKVNPARPKPEPEAQAENELKEKSQPKAAAESEQYPRQEREQRNTRVYPVFNKYPVLKHGRVRPSGQPGTYKGGRRARSFMKRWGATGRQEEADPRQRSRDNPMRWRKRKDQTKPWQKSRGEHKPWKKAEGEARPWKKAEGESKPWKRPAGDAKPWRKSSKRPQKSGFKGRRKPKRL